MDTPLIVEYVVSGEPRPQGSKTPVVRGNRAFLIEGKGKAPALHKKWRAAVAAATRQAMIDFDLEEVDYAVRLELEFRLVRPASKKKNILAPWVKPDLDKLVRSVGDGMTTSKTEPGLLLRDDSRVVELECSKYYVDTEADQGVVIRVYDIRAKCIEGYGDTLF